MLSMTLQLKPESSPVVSLGKTRETHAGGRRGTRDAQPRSARGDGKQERERLPSFLLPITPSAPRVRAPLVS